MVSGCRRPKAPVPTLELSTSALRLAFLRIDYPVLRYYHSLGKTTQALLLFGFLWGWWFHSTRALASFIPKVGLPWSNRNEDVPKLSIYLLWIQHTDRHCYNFTRVAYCAFQTKERINHIRTCLHAPMVWTPRYVGNNLSRNNIFTMKSEKKKHFSVKNTRLIQKSLKRRNVFTQCFKVNACSRVWVAWKSKLVNKTINKSRCTINTRAFLTCFCLLKSCETSWKVQTWFIGRADHKMCIIKWIVQCKQSICWRTL